MIYATIRNMNLKESKESARNLALLLQVALQFPFSHLPYCNPQLSHISINMNDFFQLQLSGAVRHYQETKSKNTDNK